MRFVLPLDTCMQAPESFGGYTPADTLAYVLLCVRRCSGSRRLLERAEWAVTTRRTRCSPVVKLAAWEVRGAR